MGHSASTACLKKLWMRDRERERRLSPSELRDEQRGAGYAQHHEGHRVDDGFDEGQASGDSRQHADHHFKS